MSNVLAAWLAEQRPTLLPRWVDLLENFPPPSEAVDPEAAVTTLVPPALDVAQLYAATITAATGDPAALSEALRTLALADGFSDDLALTLDLLSQLRCAARDLLFATSADPATTLVLYDGLSALFEDAARVIAKAWADHTSELLREREFIAESLDAASDAADRRALQLQSLNVISQQLSAILEADQLIDLLMTNLQRLTGVAHLAIWFPVELGTVAENAELVVTPGLLARQSFGDEQTPVTGLELPLSFETDLVVRAFVRASLQFEAQPNPTRNGAWLQPGCGALALPMIASEQPVAVVVLQDPDPVNQLRLQQDLAQGVISQTAIAMQNAHLYAEVRALNVDLERRVAERTSELQDEKDRLATIHQISTEVSSTLDLDNLLTTSLQLLADITRAEHASIMLVEQDDSSLLMTRAVLGVPASNPNDYLRFPIGTGIAGWVAQHRVGVLIDDIACDPRWVAAPGGSARKRQGAMIAVPLVMQGDVLGVLSLSHREPGFFHEGHLRMLNACAGAIAIGVNNANLFQMISAEAERRYELLDRQEKESSQIQAILQSLSDGVIVCDLEGRVLVINPASANILQRAIEDLLLWNLHDILMRYMGERSSELPLADLLRRPLTRDDQPRYFQTILTIGMRTVSLSLGPVLKDNGEMLGALLLLRDISREIEADRMKTEFIATMSHELRTPMTAIKGFTQLLSMGGLGPLNETQREFVTTIFNNTERMIALINDVLDITKIESGNIDLEWRSLHLAETLSGVVTELRTMATERNHELTLTIPPGLPLVRADAHRLHQILYNLLMNALKYTPKGGRVWVEATEAHYDDLPEAVRDTLAQGQRFARLDIRDTGVGIAEADQARIFDRFYRTENPLKIEAGGTGLGLSLVKPLVQVLGGRIWVRSTVGEGSTFSLILPAA
ncbi:MAG: ATP-binding protein [Oscillochloridaceae bacterium umkhey_bin13]